MRYPVTGVEYGYPFWRVRVVTLRIEQEAEQVMALLQKQFPSCVVRYLVRTWHG